MNQLLPIGIFHPINYLSMHPPSTYAATASFLVLLASPALLPLHSSAVLVIFLQFQKARPSLDVPVVLAWLLFPSLNSIYCNTC